VDILKEKLADPRWINSVVDAHRARGAAAVSQFIFQPPIPTALYGAELIDAHLFLWQNDMRVERMDYLMSTRAAAERVRALGNKIRSRLGRR
jgi:hypothetical protein